MKFTGLVVAGAFALSCGQVLSAARCSPLALEQCRDTNALIWSPEFKTELRHFFGLRRANFLYGGNPLLSDQAIAVLGGPPDEPQHIGELWRFTACRAHSCDEKGAAVLRPDGELVAVAILHMSCGETAPELECGFVRTLSIYIHQSDQSPNVIENLAGWVKGKANRIEIINR